MVSKWRERISSMHSSGCLLRPTLSDFRLGLIWVCVRVLLLASLSGPQKTDQDLAYPEKQKLRDLMLLGPPERLE